MRKRDWLSLVAHAMYVQHTYVLALTKTIAGIVGHELGDHSGPFVWDPRPWREKK